MKWVQKEITLAAKRRGFHLVTEEIMGQVPELKDFKVGLAHIFIMHTSASLTINENADPSVRRDMETHFNKIAPENSPHYTHKMEGPDDMPAHLKSVILGSSVSIPISRGELNLGTWQGVYLCEHRDHGGARRITVTLSGE